MSVERQSDCQRVRLELTQVYVIRPTTGQVWHNAIFIYSRYKRQNMIVSFEFMY